MRKTLFALATAPFLLGNAVVGTFPVVGDGWTDDYVHISALTTQQLLAGMTRHQVYHLLGEPHFNEGIRSKTWNYAFALHQPKASAPIKCDLQLVYDDGRVAKIDWRGEGCSKTATGQ
jgi:outer membrane protein assembly factor BamE (lipoprotein component of BamABCDE complex)